MCCYEKLVEIYNLIDVIPFVEALEKTRNNYMKDEIDMIKDCVSIPGISMTYVMNKAIKLKDRNDPELFAPGQPCTHKCEETCDKKGCKKCKQTEKDCEICPKNKAYDLLKTGMVGGPSIVFCRYAEKDVTKIRPQVYGDNAKTCKSVVGFDENSLYLYCLGDEMPCRKEEYVEVKDSKNAEVIDKICEDVIFNDLFGFFQVDIYVPEELREKFREFSPLFVVDEVSEDKEPQHMKDYKENTGRKTLKGTKKLLGVCKAHKILLYSKMLAWYLKHGLKVTAIHSYVKYVS